MSKHIICGVYKITSPNGRIYIGQTADVAKRLRSYRTVLCKKQPLLYNSLLKYGWDRHIFEVIHECEKSELNHWEKIYIAKYNSTDKEIGLNLREGGDYGGKLCLESREKIRKTLLGKAAGEKNPFFGRKHSPETLLKMRSPRSQEVREKMKIGAKKRRDAGMYKPKRILPPKEPINQLEVSHRIRKSILSRKNGKTSKYIGVNGYHKTSKIVDGVKVYNKWVSKIRHDGKRITLGLFKTQDEAAIAYNEAAIKYHGEFANLNVID